MTSIETASQFGYTYSHDCSKCDGKYGSYLNNDFPGIEVRIRKSKDYVKIFKGGKQIATATALTLEERLRELNLIKETVNA